MSEGVCPVCGRRFARAQTGRPRIYCGDRCKVAHFRGTHPLGSQLIREMGIEDLSLLQLLAEAGNRFA
jgi:hypothetical protein